MLEWHGYCVPLSNRRKDGTFRKGHTGNPKGRPRKHLDNAPTSAPTPAPAPVHLDDAQIVPGISVSTLRNWATHLDGWASSTTGIGQPGVDKRLTHRMVVPTLSYQDAIAIYRGDDIAKRAIEAPVRECFRQGYEITISDEGKFDELKEDIEDKIEELELNEALQRAMFYNRAYGGSAILLGTKDSNKFDEPLDLNSIQSLDWLNVLEPIELIPLSYYEDPESAKYGKVEYYQLTTFTTAGAAAAASIGAGTDRLPPANIRRIHETRLVVFGGQTVSRYQIQNGLAGTSWGDSILTALIDVLRDFNVSWSAAGLLAVDFGQPVISVEGLMLLVAKNPGDFFARMRALEEGRSTARAILIDAKKEKFERQGTTLTGFSELLNGLSMRLAAAVDMPLTLLMGQSPKGLGNEGESDVRFYYDRIRGKQVTEVGPLLRKFIKIIMNTLRKRKLPRKWKITFAELWQLTDAEKAQAHLTQARTDSTYIRFGVLYPDEVRKSRFGGGYSYDTQIDEKKDAPGFLTPPPNGTPGSPRNPNAPGMPPSNTGPNGGGPSGGGGNGVAMGPNAHAVVGYARRNPIAGKEEPGSTEGEGEAQTEGGGEAQEDSVDPSTTLLRNQTPPSAMHV